MNSAHVCRLPFVAQKTAVVLAAAAAVHALARASAAGPVRAQRSGEMTAGSAVSK